MDITLMSSRYVDSDEHGKQTPVPPDYIPRENDGWFDIEALLGEEVREREVDEDD
jgi:hypothetical protein